MRKLIIPILFSIVCTSCMLEEGVECVEDDTMCGGKNKQLLMICLEGKWETDELCTTGCYYKNRKAFCVSGQDDEECTGDSCKKAECKDGVKTCSGQTLKTCKSGKWVKTKCKHACENNICVDQTESDDSDDPRTPDDPKGTDAPNDPEKAECQNEIQCSSDGKSLLTCKDSLWETTPCEYGCEANKCIEKSESCPKEKDSFCQIDGKTLHYCLNGEWLDKDCPYGCLNDACLVSPNESIQVNREKLVLAPNQKGTITATYYVDKKTEGHKTLQIKRSLDNCFTTSDELTTDSDGNIVIEVQALKVQAACSGEIIIVSPEENGAKTSVKVEVSLADENHNYMYDGYETAPNQGTPCQRYSDCDVSGNPGFCDSFIGYRCSTKCKSNDECLNRFLCRPDGRCASDTFETVWKLSDTKFALPTKVAEKCNFDVDWGDGKKEHVDQSKCGTHVTHVYPTAGTYHVKITGTYDGWRVCNLGILCSNLNGNECLSYVTNLVDIISFGPVGLGYSAFINTGLTQLSAIDIPDASKLLNAANLFCHTDNFNSDISNWDMSYTTDFRFILAKAIAFTQDISKWDISKVTSWDYAFYHTGFVQNKNQYCSILENNASFLENQSKYHNTVTCP